MGRIDSFIKSNTPMFPRCTSAQAGYLRRDIAESHGRGTYVTAETAVIDLAALASELAETLIALSAYGRANGSGSIEWHEVPDVEDYLNRHPLSACLIDQLREVEALKKKYEYIGSPVIGDEVCLRKVEF